MCQIKIGRYDIRGQGSLAGKVIIIVPWRIYQNLYPNICPTASKIHSCPSWMEQDGRKSQAENI